MVSLVRAHRLRGPAGFCPRLMGGGCRLSCVRVRVVTHGGMGPWPVVVAGELGVCWVSGVGLGCGLWPVVVPGAGWERAVSLLPGAGCWAMHMPCRRVNFEVCAALAGPACGAPSGGAWGRA